MFISVEQESFLNDIIKTWIAHFQNSGMSTQLTFRVATPDTDIALKLPTVTLRRVSNDEWSLNRIGGHFGRHGETATAIQELYGYTYVTMFQFDIVTTTMSENNTVQGELLKAIKPSIPFQDTLIPLRHFASHSDTVGTKTDLKIKFGFQDDVDGATISTFDPNLHQHSVSVRFQVDYLSEKEVPKILNIQPTYNIF